jgi:two-component system response regulator DegU
VSKTRKMVNPAALVAEIRASAAKRQHQISYVLVVDEAGVLRDGIQQVIARLENTRVVGAVSSAMEAADLLQHVSPHIIVTEYGTGEHNALWLTAQLGKLSDPPSVLLFSAQSQPQRVLACIEAGARGYLPKTCSQQELELALREIRQGRTYLHPEVALATVNQARQSYQLDSSAETLSPEEKQLLLMTVSGFSNQDIAAVLMLSVSAVKAHLRGLFSKLEAQDRLQAVVQAVRRGFLSTPELCAIQFKD